MQSALWVCGRPYILGTPDDFSHCVIFLLISTDSVDLLLLFYSLQCPGCSFWCDVLFVSMHNDYGVSCICW